MDNHHRQVSLNNGGMLYNALTNAAVGPQMESISCAGVPFMRIPPDTKYVIKHPLLRSLKNNATNRIKTEPSSVVVTQQVSPSAHTEVKRNVLINPDCQISVEQGTMITCPEGHALEASNVSFIKKQNNIVFNEGTTNKIRSFEKSTNEVRCNNLPTISPIHGTMLPILSSKPQRSNNDNTANHHKQYISSYSVYPTGCISDVNSQQYNYDPCIDVVSGQLHQKNKPIIASSKYEHRSISRKMKQRVVYQKCEPPHVDFKARLISHSFAGLQRSEANSLEMFPNSISRPPGVHQNLHRSISDGQYSVQSELESRPLDLATSRSSSTQELSDIANSVEPRFRSIPQNSLSMLAMVATARLREDTSLTSDSYNSSRSTPSSITESTSSQSTLDEEQRNDEYRLEPNPQEYINENEFELKFEGSDSFETGAIILNSNNREEIHQQVFPQYAPELMNADQENHCILKEVVNFSVTNHVAGGCSPVSPSGYINYANGRDSEDNTNGSDNNITDDAAFANLNEPLANPVEGRKRLRLPKSEYDRMSVSERKRRHRLLDNQRSKQYRDGRRSHLAVLKDEVAGFENLSTKLACEKSSLELQIEMAGRALNIMGVSVNGLVSNLSIKQEIS